MEGIDIVFYIGVLIFSIIIHEVMHGVAADRLGDPTARYAGRLTLNPIPHIDLWGSIIIPTVLVLTNSPIFFGYAKPVPYNPYNLRPGRFSEAIVAFAGPLSNAAIAIALALVLRLGIVGPEAGTLLYIGILINVMLFFFNLIPIPPLDGSKVLEAILPPGLDRVYGEWRSRLEGNPFLGFGLVIIVVYLMGSALGNFVSAVARALIGI